MTFGEALVKAITDGVKIKHKDWYKSVAICADEHGKLQRTTNGRSYIPCTEDYLNSLCQTSGYEIIDEQEQPKNIVAKATQWLGDVLSGKQDESPKVNKWWGKRL